MSPLRPPTPDAIILVIARPIEPGDIAPLCACAHELLQRSTGDLLCDVGALTDPDATSVDALARLQLTVMRCGRRLRLCHVSARLRSLLELVGLRDVVPLAPDLPLQPGGETEEWEQASRVEEEGDAGDPSA